MAVTLTLKIGTPQSVYTSPLSDAATIAKLEWFIHHRIHEMPEGLTTQQQNQWKMDTVVEELVKYIRQRAFQNEQRAINEQRELEDHQRSQQATF